VWIGQASYDRRPFQNGGKLVAWLRRISTDAYKQRDKSLPASRLSLFWNGLQSFTFKCR
jgi:hypothetical protein